MYYDCVDGRHFDNGFADYSPDCKEIAGNKISPQIVMKIEKVIGCLTEHITGNLNLLDKRDVSVYTGTSGVGYMFDFLAKQETCPNQKKKWEKFSHELLKKVTRHCDKQIITFLCGDSGPLLTSLIAGIGEKDNVVQNILKLKSVAVQDQTPDELLYGRVGYLYALLMLHRLNIQRSNVETVITHVVAKILHSGFNTSKTLSVKGPLLMYSWYNSYYLGAAHGLAGILYLLMEVPTELIENGALKSLIRPTIEWMISLQFPSSNFPPCWGDETEDDKLVHWCHGAPGWIYMFAKAYEVFQEKRYLTMAVVCGEVIWRRGLLRKGYGLCHGVAGNGYAFLRLYRLTGDLKYLYRAVKFAEFCCDYGTHGCREPDRPLSLYEGMAGTIYFLKDILDPQNARFPGFEV